MAFDELISVSILSIRPVKLWTIGLKAMITRVENVLIIRSPYPIGHIFVITEISDNNGLPANSGRRFYITLICVGQRFAFLVNILGLARETDRLGRLRSDKGRLDFGVLAAALGAHWLIFYLKIEFEDYTKI